MTEEYTNLGKTETTFTVDRSRALEWVKVGLIALVFGRCKVVMTTHETTLKTTSGEGRGPKLIPFSKGDA